MIPFAIFSLDISNNCSAATYSFRRSKYELGSRLSFKIDISGHVRRFLVYLNRLLVLRKSLIS